MAGQETGQDKQDSVKVQDARKGVFSKVRGWFSKPQTPEVFPPIRESAAEILSRTTLPDRSVTLDDISIYRVFPIDFGATRRLALAINQIKETPIDQFELSQLKPPIAVYAAIPWAASTIAHHYNHEIPVILPNEEDVVAMRPWLRNVSNFLGRFSPRIQYRFGRFIEKKAKDAIDEATRNVLKRVDTIGQIDHPKARFVPELAQVYKEVTKPEYEADESFDLGEALGSIFGEESAPRQVEVPIERKVANLVVNLRYAKHGSPHGWVNKNAYPLMARALEISQFPPDSVDEGTAGIVGSEIMHGVSRFLRARGIVRLPSVPRPVRTLYLLNPDTWTGESLMRSLAETFAWQQVQAVEEGLPSILTEVYNILPESGPEVVNAVRTLSEDILILSKQGVSNAEIAVALFRKSQAAKK